MMDLWKGSGTNETDMADTDRRREYDWTIGRLTCRTGQWQVGKGRGGGFKMAEVGGGL